MSCEVEGRVENQFTMMTILKVIDIECEDECYSKLNVKVNV